MHTLRFKDAHMSTWPTGSEWVWLDGRVRFMNGVDTGISNAMSSILILDKGLVVLTLKGRADAEQVWDHISMELINHGILCEPLYPIHGDNVLPLPILDVS